MPEPVLYDYQAEHMNALREARELKIATDNGGERSPRVLFQAPTGYGKTHCFTWMAYRTNQRGLRMGVGAHLEEILLQVSERFTRFGIAHDFISAKGRNGDNKIKLFMDKTFAKKQDQEYPFDWGVFDECHRDPGATRTRIREKSPNTRWMGCTATPARSDGRGMDYAYDSMVTTMQIKELNAINLLDPTRGLVPCVLYRPPNKHLDTRNFDDGDEEFNLEKAAKELDRAKITGDVIREYKKKCPGASAIVFDATVKRAKETAERFTAAGIPAAFIDGAMDTHQRAAIYRAYVNGSIKVLVNVNLFLEGVDIPGVQAVFWLRPTKSIIVWLQGNGRGMRAMLGKTCVLIFDHAGNTFRLGRPDAYRQWTLEGRPKGARRFNEGAHLKHCDECDGEFEPGPKFCPLCGAEFTARERKIITVGGELIIDQDDPALTQFLIHQKEEEIIGKRLRDCRTESDCIKLADFLGRDRSFGKHLWHRKTKYRKPQAKLDLADLEEERESQMRLQL